MEERVFINEYVSTSSATVKILNDNDCICSMEEQNNDETVTEEELDNEYEYLDDKIKNLTSDISNLLTIQNQYLTDVVKENNLQIDRLIKARYKMDDKIRELENEQTYLYKWLIFSISVSILSFTILLSILYK